MKWPFSTGGVRSRWGQVRIGPDPNGTLTPKSTPWRALEFLVCDAEMSSLDADTGCLLSLAWVPLERGAVYPGRGQHHLVRGEGQVGDSAVIHGIRDRDSAAGEDAVAVLDAWLEAATGRILVFHHAPLDLAYLDRLSRLHYHTPLSLPVVDTLARERRRRQRRGQVSAPGDLTLQGCRRHYGLPDYPAHNALSDALATAELLLAQLVHAGEDVTLRDLL